MNGPERNISKQYEEGPFRALRPDILMARLLMLSFFFPQKLQGLIAMVAGLYFVVRTVASKTPVPRASYLWAMGIGSIYLLYLGSIPFTPPHYKSFLLTLCERKVSLLLLPFVFAITAQRFRAIIIHELRFFVYGCLISCIVGNAGFIYHLLQNSQGFLALSHVEYRVTFEAYTGLHPTYMGMFLCFSICITMLSGAFVGRWGEVARYVIVCILAIFLLALLAKSPLIALVLIACHYGYVRRQQLLKYKIQIVGFVVVVAVACFFIPFIGQRFREVLQFAGVGKPGDVAGNSVYVRKLLWNVDTDLLRQYWLTGVGPGRLLHMLHERYFFYSIANHFSVGYYDPHNQYFWEWLSFGIIGIIAPVLTLVLHFARAIRFENYLYLCLLIILCVTFFTETVLSRQQGILFYAVFTSLFFFNSVGKRPISNS